MMPTQIALLFALLMALVGFLGAPALVAWFRRHPERKLIYKLSPLSFFSFLLWFALIIWAASDRRDDAVISKWVAKLRSNNRLPILIALLVVGGLASSLIFLLR